MMNVKNTTSYRGFNSFSKFLRQLSTPISLNRRNLVYAHNSGHVDQWPNDKLGPVNSIHPKYPLPGSVGIILPKSPTQLKDFIPEGAEKVITSLPHGPEPHYTFTLINANRTYEDEHPDMTVFRDVDDSLECKVQHCPHLLRDEFLPLFPERELAGAKLTVITLSHKTQYSMEKLSDEVIAEREKLAQEFINVAIDVCAVLRGIGYWADFIDPFTGYAYLNPHTESNTGTLPPQALVETDPRMGRLGFTVDELGCCKILRHPVFGHNLTAGLIFTDAPVGHPLLAKLLSQQTSASTDKLTTSSAITKKEALMSPQEESEEAGFTPVDNTEFYMELMSSKSGYIDSSDHQKIKTKNKVNAVGVKKSIPPKDGPSSD